MLEITIINPCYAQPKRKEIVHVVEYYLLEAQKGDRWAAEDKKLDAKLAALRKKHGRPPNIVYLLWDDMTFGAVGFPGLQKNFGFTTPNLNRMRPRHELMKKKYRDKKKACGIPYTGFSNARPETKAIAEQMNRNIQNMPFDVKEYLEFEIPGSKADPDFGK